jgi:uncharacterized protein YpmB
MVLFEILVVSRIKIHLNKNINMKKKSIIIFITIIVVILVFVGYIKYTVNQSVKDVERISREAEELAEQNTGITASKLDALKKELKEINDTL